MRAECSAASGAFQAVSGRKVVAEFDGGSVTSDAGALLLGEADAATGLLDRFAACFEDHRDARFVEHNVRTLVGQRVFGIALGYEDLVDHDILRHDPMIAVLAGKLRSKRSDCAPVAGKSTLNRLELGGARPFGNRKIVHDGSAIEDLFVTLFVEAHERVPKRVILDFDATDDPVHGTQEGRFFHGYYDCYCYLPLYVCSNRHLLAAKLRPANIDGAAGAVEEAARIVSGLRARWPDVRVLLRGDSGFARDGLMSWCEANGVDYLFGLARNKRLEAEVSDDLACAGAESRRAGEPRRRFKDFMWRTRKGWGRARRVVAKAEWTHGKANPRFVVTSLGADEYNARRLYQDLYCQRGEMENRIKECQLDLFADRTSSHGLRANQLRLWFASPAYELVCAVRRLGLAGTRLAVATCGSVRLKLFKIGAWVRVSVRRIKIAMDSDHPFREEFRIARRRLSAAAV